MSSEAMEVRDAAGSYALKAEQDVPPGYQRTEVGVIPEDWSVATLFAIAGERKQNFDDGDWVEAEFLTNSGVCLLQTGNIGVGKFIDKTEKKYISDPSFDLLRCKEIKPGDLLICRLAKPAGRACIAPDLGEPRMITAVDVTIFRPLPEIADARYLLYVFSTPWWFSEVADRCGGSTRSRIARGELAKIKVALPSVSEQRAIATVLSDVDALITALDKLIAKKRAIKTAAMQQLLTGKTRLPGFSGEWETKRLGELAEVVSGGTPKSGVAEYWDGGIFWCTPTDITKTQGKYIDSTERTISKEGLLASPAHLLPPGAILLCTRATIGEMKISMVPIATNQGFKSLVCKQGVSSEFLYYKLLIEKSRLIEKASGSTFLEISKRDVVELTLRLPEIEEQTAIAQVLSDMDAEIAALEARRDKTHAIKQGMMQQLLTGRVRLVTADGKEAA